MGLFLGGCHASEHFDPTISELNLSLEISWLNESQTQCAAESLGWSAYYTDSQVLLILEEWRGIPNPSEMPQEGTLEEGAGKAGCPHSDP